jgi:transcriptional regulator with XRE-family HTH domain
MSTAADIIKSARLHAGLSLRELARRARTSHATLSRYEDGSIEPSFAVVERIVQACGLELRIQLAPPDREERDLAASFLRLSPRERLQSLANVDRLRHAVRR